jgi:hypothetical protein
VAAAVPDSDSVRRAALQASWQRGRWVARRRLWWRWTAWALLRFVLPAAAVLAVLGGLMYGWNLATSTPAATPTAAPMKVPAAGPSTPRHAVPPATAADPLAAPAGTASLRLDWAASVQGRAKTAPTSAPSSASTPTTNVGDSRP